MNKRFLLLVGIIIALFAGIIFFNNRQSNQPSNNTVGKPSENYRGKLDSPVTFLEFGDFQCPSCGQYYPLVNLVYGKYKDYVKFQFRNMPLTQIHPNALAASRAAEAAANQGKFWEMHDKIYESQNEWSQSRTASTYFETYATQLGLDFDRFKRDVIDSATNSRINADKEEMNKLNLTLETPTYIIDGKKVELANLQTLEDFSKYIDEALKAKGITPPATPVSTEAAPASE